MNEIELGFKVKDNKLVFVAQAFDSNIVPQCQEVIETNEDEYVLDALKGLEIKLRKRLKEKLKEKNE